MRRPSVTAAVAFAAWSAIAPAWTRAATVITSPFRGVTHYQRTEPAGAVVPRQVVMHIVEIDLGASGIRFMTTPGNGAAPGEFTAQTTSQFVQQHNLQIGLNGDFFASAGTGPNGEIYRNVTNLAASNGELISPWPGSGTARGAMNISRSNVATLVRPADGTSTNYLTNPSLTPYNAIGGNARMLNAGNVITNDTTIHPRTCIGYKGNRLFLFAVDGRQPGYSEGMTLVEIANFMKTEYGLTHLLNLDGGGSTTLVMADPTRRVVNRPSDGSERYNGNNFGVFARLWPHWAIDAGGNWSLAGNWSDGVPNGVGHVAHLKNTISANRTIVIDAPVTLGTINFDAQKTYTIGGPQQLTLDTAVGNAAVNINTTVPQVLSAPLKLNDATDVTVVTNGNFSIAAAVDNSAGRTLNKNGGGTLSVSGAQTHGVGAAINVNAGTLALLSNAGSAAAANLTINANAGATNFLSDQNLNALAISATATATITPGGLKTVRTKSLAIAPGGKFNLADNDLIIDYAGAASPLGSATTSGIYSGVTGLLQTGRGSDGAWTGPGIHSTHAATTAGLTALAVAEASEVLGLTGAQTATWSGQTVDATTILLRYTYDGDANLDGRIDAGDYGIIDNFVQIPGAFGYAHGDFNLDGFIDAGDYGIIDNNVQRQGGPFPAGSAFALTVVPEPSFAALALCALACGCARSRRQTRPCPHHPSFDVRKP